MSAICWAACLLVRALLPLRDLPSKPTWYGLASHAGPQASNSDTVSSSEAPPAALGLTVARPRLIIGQLDAGCTGRYK